MHVFHCLVPIPQCLAFCSQSTLWCWESQNSFSYIQLPFWSACFGHQPGWWPEDDLNWATLQQTLSACGSIQHHTPVTTAMLIKSTLPGELRPCTPCALTIPVPFIPDGISNDHRQINRVAAKIYIWWKEYWVSDLLFACKEFKRGKSGSFHGYWCLHLHAIRIAHQRLITKEINNPRIKRTTVPKLNNAPARSKDKVPHCVLSYECNQVSQHHCEGFLYESSPTSKWHIKHFDKSCKVPSVNPKSC